MFMYHEIQNLIKQAVELGHNIRKVEYNDTTTYVIKSNKTTFIYEVCIHINNATMNVYSYDFPEIISHSPFLLVRTGYHNEYDMKAHFPELKSIILNLDDIVLKYSYEWKKYKIEKRKKYIENYLNVNQNLQ